jgi:DNA helicase-2/ATP-dependent DNA helicase PcrA
VDGANLNERQREAVRHEGGPLLVVAGAGTGKTRVIAHRLAQLIAERSIPPERIVAVTFTNRAAGEMRVRVADMVGERGSAVNIGTFHWLGHRILRRYGARSIGPGFELFTPAQSLSTTRRLMKHGNHPNREITPADLRDAVRAHRNVGPERAIELPHIDVAAFAADYVAELRKLRALDLDDLVLETVSLLEENARVRARLQNSLKHVLVDEYQDTNPPQIRLLQLLAPRGMDITAVGDDDQSIYGWRHADPRTMLDFSTHFPGATIVRLEENYRSTQRILQAANELLRANRARLGKTLFSRVGAGRKPVIFAAGDESEEALFVASQIRRLLAQGAEPQEIAILFRMNAQSRIFEDALVRAGIAYEVRGGRRFYERPEVARLVDSLRVLIEPASSSDWARLIRHVPGMGPARTDAVVAALERSGEPASVFLSAGDVPAPAAAGRAITRLANRLSGLNEGSDLGSLVRSLADVWNELQPQTSTTAAERDAVAANIEEFVSAAAQFASTGTGGVAELLDLPALSEVSGPTEGVQLMTIHAAKGLEFDAVFIAGVEEGLLPHRRSVESWQIEEERRLLYVAMTRARRRLCLSYARARFAGGTGTETRHSRFLDDMPPLVFEVRHGLATLRKDRLTRVGRGDRVEHPRWGAGRVREVEGNGRQTMVTIEFADGSRQRVQLCHAPLKRIS